MRRSNWLSNLLTANVYLKFECFQPGGSFKIRGATNSLLTQIKLPNRVITASGGNHGMGVATIAKILHIPALIVLPEGISNYRKKILEEIGAEVIIKGKSYDEANNYAIELAEISGDLYIHAFQDTAVIQGQGTIAVEILDELPEVNSIVASVGGGGLLTGISLAVEAFGMSEKIKLYAVETEGANCFNASLKNQKVVTLDAITSIATTLGARRMSDFNFKTLSNFVTKSFVVSDKEAVQGMVDFLNNEKIIVEPATSCIIPALILNKSDFEGKNIVLVVCGSNVIYDDLLRWKSQFLDILD